LAENFNRDDMRNILFCLLWACVLVSCSIIEGDEETNPKKPSDSLQKMMQPIFPGMLPVEFRLFTTLSAGTGGYVLAPCRSYIDAGFNCDSNNVAFMYNSAVVVKFGPIETLLREPGDTVSVPNAVIIPMAPSQSVRKGDIVLTWWQTGAGLQRALVVDDSLPGEPKVLYLDLPWDGPLLSFDSIPVGQIEERLLPGSFIRLDQDWQQGSRLAWQKDDELRAVLLINSDSNKLLVTGWSGLVWVADKKDCFPVKTVFNYAKGDSVKVPFHGNFTPAVVVHTIPEAGRIRASIRFLDKDSVLVVPVTDVIR
jgi:hypothetical protein